MQTVALARNAMATRFEIVLHGENPVSLRAAGEEALDEIEHVEAQLSLYRPGSEISRLNARGAREWVRVSPAVFHLLELAALLGRETGGTFDVTIAPLVRCWGFMGGTGAKPRSDEVARAREMVGMNLVEFDAENFSVRFKREGVMIDLGAIGKGYGIERAANALREAGVESCLVNGGTSSVHAIGHPPGQEHWKIALEYPGEPQKQGRLPLLATIPLRDESLSVSAVWGRSFQSDNQTFGHVLDPRTGCPVRGAVLSAVVCDSATESDALSTALLVLGSSGHDALARIRPGLRTLVLDEGEGGKGFVPGARGIEIHPQPPK